ncbi:WxL domain-containing protein [Enterococcus ureilyticus]|uniref:WxL domain-containing protein n=1 Tax=Enterococcus ureilyticus TaxID=1131292 RepID=UPI001A933C7C|nr:WxL domain-containing protein [Enterococcus ureilyticus]MBO0446469.1 WxL domain-containing protein [Enterococcus ureilyticus]
MMKKNLLAHFLILLGLFFFAQNSYAETTTLEVTSLEQPNWIFKTGMSRAKYHDRQDLGIVVNGGSTIKIRRTSVNDGYNNLTLWLLGNNRTQEKSVPIANEWKTVPVEHSAVPFINTPYGENDAEVEYEIDGVSVALPVYESGSNEQTFFSKWRDTNAAFGLVKGEQFQLLIPNKEKEQAESLKDFSDLDQYITYQNSIINYYDELMGLSETVSGVNKKPENRFFLKADGGTGPGIAAYYQDNYSSNGKDTVVNRWMTKWDWGTLHEIGHAYQPSYNNRDMYTAEVSNNVLAVFYTYDFRGKAIVEKNSWLYNFGNKATVESGLYSRLVEQQIGYPDLDHRGRLILLNDLTQSVGKENWTKLNVMYREAVNNGDENIKNMSLPDLFNLFYSSQMQKDYSPVLLKWGLPLTEQRQRIVNRGKSYSAVTSLVDVVPKEKLKDAVSLLSPSLMVDSQFSLVTNQEIAALNLPGGALTIHLNIHDFAQIKGKKIGIKDGDQLVKEVEINEPDIVIPKLENGVYTLQLPKTEGFYEADNYYAYVRDAQNKTTVNLTEIKGSRLYDETIQFKGLYDRVFGVIQTDFMNQKMIIDVTSTTPHTYFKGQLYASIEVFDEFDQLIYHKEMEGTDVVVEKSELPLKEGYKIKLYHAETTNRLTAATETLIDPTLKSNVLLVKNGYLVNENRTPGIAVAKEKITSAIDTIKSDAEWASVDNNPEKTQITVAILSLPEAERDVLLELHQDFLEIHPGTITIQYVDNKGVELDKSEIFTGRFGEKITVNAKEIKGYELDVSSPLIELNYQLKPQVEKFIYKKDYTSISPVNPEDPDKIMIPNEMSVKPNNNPLKILHVSNFHFGQQAMTLNAQTYNAILENGKNEAGLTENFANSVQISDERETNAGWRLQVRQEEQFTSVITKKELVGAQIILKNLTMSKGKSNSAGLATVSEKELELIPDGMTTIDVATAEAKMGMGTQVVRFGDKGSTAETSIQLDVPAQPQLVAEKYTTTLTWILNDSPI